jgi:hypothetical protein
MTYPTTFQDMERLLLPQPAQPAEVEPVALIEPEPEPEAIEADAPPVPDFDGERGLDWIATARAALFVETESEGGDPK